jgi:hypothetical protein
VLLLRLRLLDREQGGRKKWTEGWRRRNEGGRMKGKNRVASEEGRPGKERAEKRNLSGKSRIKYARITL